MTTKQTCRVLVTLPCVGLLAALLPGIHSAGAAVVETGSSQSYQAYSVPAVSSNLLSAAVLTANNPSPYPNPTGTSWAVLTDGEFGSADGPSGGAGAGASATASVGNGYTLTYTMDTSINNAGYALSNIDTYSAWGDSGRFWQNYTVSYQIVGSTDWINLANVAYQPPTDASPLLTDAHVNLSLSSIFGVKAVQFAFNNVQNSYVGYRELAVQGSPTPAWASTTGGDWNTGSNWTTGTAPDAPDALAVLGTALSDNTNPVNISSSVTVGTLVFGNPVRYTLSATPGASLALAGSAGAAIQALYGSHTISAPLVLGSDTSLSVRNATDALTLSGDISASGSQTLTLAGPGTVVLSSTNNSYGGITVFQGGVVNVASLADYGLPCSVGNRAADFSPGTILGGVGLLFRGGTLQYTGSAAQTTNRSIRINSDGGDGYSGGATIDASGSNPGATLSFTAASSADFFEEGGNRTLTLTGSNTGSNRFAMAIQETAGQTSLVKNGVGFWVISGSNSFSGGTTINGGTLQMGSANALGGGGAAVNSGVLDLAGYSPTLSRLSGSAGTVTNSGVSEVTLAVNPATATSFGGTLQDGAGTLSLLMSGAGTLGLGGTDSSYSGVTIFQNGVINVAGLANYGFNSSLGNRPAGVDGGQNVSMLFRGGTLQYSGSLAQSTNRAIRISTDGGATLDASGSNPAATLSFTAPSSPDFFENPGTRTLTLTGSNAGANVFAMAIIDQGTNPTSLVKSGVGTWNLAGANNFSGGTTIQAGTLNFVNGAVGSGPITFTGGVLQYAAGNTQDVSARILNSSAPMALDTNGGYVTYYASLNASNSGGLTKLGTGTLAVGGGNAYAGNTTVLKGTLQLGAAGAPFSAVAHYTFNGNTNDVSGTGNQAVPVNGPSYTAGRFGQAITLNGSSQYLTVPYSSSLGLNAYTVSLWVDVNGQPAYTGESGGPALVSTRNGGDGTFDLQYWQFSPGNYKLHADIGDGSNFFATGADYTLPGPLTGWNMITYSVSSSGYTIYVNGVPVTSGAVNGGTPLFMKSGQTLSFGAQEAGGGFGNGGFLNGSLDEVNIIGSALNSAQVNNLFLGVVGQLPSATAAFVAQGATFDLNGGSQTVAALSDYNGSGGTVTNSSANPSVLTVNPTSGSTTFSGTIEDGAGGGTVTLALSGSGTLVLSGSNTYTGGTYVVGGTLIVASPSAIQDGTSLTVGAHATSIFGASVAGGQVASAAVSPVPEPGTLALLAAGLVVGFGVWRRKAMRD